MSGANEPRTNPGQLRQVGEILDRVDRLTYLRAAWEDPLAWYAEALHLGDLKTIAMTAIRSEEQYSACS